MSERSEQVDERMTQYSMHRFHTISTHSALPTPLLAPLTHLLVRSLACSALLASPALVYSLAHSFLRFQVHWTDKYSCPIFNVQFEFVSKFFFPPLSSASLLLLLLSASFEVGVVNIFSDGGGGGGGGDWSSGGGGGEVVSNGFPCRDSVCRENCVSVSII